MKSTSTAGRILRATFTAVLGLLIPAQPAFALAASDLEDISAPGPFTTFVNLLNDSNVTVDGNAGISLNGTLSPAATVNGPAPVGGSTCLNHDLSAQAQGFSDSTTLGNLAAESGANLSGHFDSVINSASVIPFDSARVLSMNRAIFAGDQQITLMSGSSLMLIGIGLGFLVAGKRRMLPY